MNNNGKTIVLFNGQSQYDVLRYFIFELADSFTKIGYNVEVIDLLKNRWINELEKIIKQNKIDFFFSMNAMGIDIKVGEKSLYDYINVPLFAFMVDHPMYHIQRLNSGVKNLIVSCIDKSHIDFLNKYMNGQYTKVFIPHGASVKYQSSIIKPIEKRSIDILFTGTYHDPENERKQWKSQPNYIAKLFDEIMEQALYQNHKSLIEIAESIFIKKGIDLVYMHHFNFWALLLHVDRYIRYQRRKEFIETISKIPVKVEIYGNGWKQISIKSKNVEVRPPIDFIQAQEKMNDSKMVATVLPNFIEGGHERIFTSMVCGAVSVVDENLYIKSNFDNKKNLISYNFEDDIADSLNELIHDTNHLQTIADNGRNLVNQKHTWFHRANKIIETVTYHKFFLS